MYAKLQFKSVSFYKNTKYSVLKTDKRVHKKTLEQLNSFFDESDTVNSFNYKKNELINVIIPNNKSYYDNGLFSSCKKLNNVTLSYNSKEISENMFFGCHTLKNIILPEGIIKIGDSAFCGCWHLEYIEIPNTICSIDLFAFEDCKCLKYIKFKGKKYTSPEKFNKALEDYGIIKFADKSEFVWSK